MICPNHTRLEMAYLCKYYNNVYEDWIDKIRLYENKYNTFFYHKNIDYIDNIIKTKWLNILNEKELSSNT